MFVIWILVGVTLGAWQADRVKALFAWAFEKAGF